MRRLVDSIWGRVRISTRIAAAIVVCLLAIQAFAVLQFLIRPEHQSTLFGLRWLCTTTEQAVASFAEPPELRNDLLQGLDASQWLELSWQPTRPPMPRADGRRHPMGDRVEATLRQALEGRVK